MSENILQNTEFDYTIKMLPAIPNVVECGEVEDATILEGGGT